jgi:ferritin-like protein
LRTFTAEKAADYFVNLNLNNNEDYWYYYYVLSKVSLKGRINETNNFAEELELPNSNEPVSDLINDEFYKKLISKTYIIPIN